MNSNQLSHGVNRALVVMAKRPEPGRTKTRLNPPLSEAEAARLYECFLQDTLDLVRAVPDVTPCIAYTPPDAREYFDHIAPGFTLIPQHGKNLSRRLDAVLRACLNRGFTHVAAISSDSPTLPATHLAHAFDILERPDTDVVFGPCEDGGYYLIGVTEPQPQLLLPVKMSTPYVLRDTLARAEAEGIRVALLPTWYDVDSQDDLRRLEAELVHASPSHVQHTREFLRRFSL